MISQEETLYLLEKAKQGDSPAKEKLIIENTPLIKSVIKRFQNKGIEYEDLFQLGSIGFLKAINNFDKTFNVKFSTYAVPMIIGEVKRFLRDDGSIKVSRAIKSLNLQINKFIQNYYNKNNQKPTIEKIAKEFKTDAQEIVFIMDSSKMPCSLYSPFDETDDNSLMIIDRVVDDQNNINIDNEIIIKEMLESLNKRDRLLIMLRYFKDKTQSEIANVLNVSQVQVSRLESKILKTLKEKMKKGD